MARGSEAAYAMLGVCGGIGGMLISAGGCAGRGCNACWGCAFIGAMILAAALCNRIKGIKRKEKGDGMAGADR